VIKPLIPLEQLKPKLINLRKAMQGASVTMDKAAASFKWVQDQPHHTHKCGDIRPVFQVPFGATNYPDSFKRLHEHINTQLEAKADTFRKEATDLIHKGHGIMCLQYKLDRINILFTHIVDEIGQYHTAYYRARFTDPTDKRDHKTIPNDKAITITAIHTLLLHLDLDVLLGRQPQHTN
jgi:hypothetical protein